LKTDIDLLISAMSSDLEWR